MTTTDPYLGARADSARVAMMSRQVERIRQIPEDQRSVADRALLQYAPAIASQAAASLATFRPPPLPAGLTPEERQAPGQPVATPFPGPLAARCARLPLEGLHARFPQLTGSVTASAQEEGERKQVSEVVVTEEDARAMFIAAAIGPVTRQALDDTPARALLETAARRAVSVALDAEVLAVLLDSTDVPAVAGSTAESVRLAAFELQASGYASLVIAGPPSDLAPLDPNGLPPGTAMIAVGGDGLVVADLSAAVGLLLRGGIGVFESATVDSEFTSNNIYMLAEAIARPVVISAEAARRIGA